VSDSANKFSRSWAGLATFVALMLLCGFGSFLFFRASFASATLRGNDVQFIPLAIMVIWAASARPFPFWFRWILPFAIAAPAFCLQALAVGNFRPAMSPAQADRATVLFACYFAYILLWIVELPLEESYFRVQHARLPRVWVWKLGFALAGLTMMAVAAFYFRRLVEEFLWDRTIANFVAARNVVLFLGIGFVALAFARFVLPMLHAIGRHRRDTSPASVPTTV
jgi:hypothetical protein